MIDKAVHSRIYIDTTIFVGAFEADTDISQQLRSIFEILRMLPKTAVTSEITLAEVLGKESQVYGWARQTRFYLDLLIFNSFIDLRPVSREILLSTGDYRRAAGRKISLPDAIHVVSAIESGCRWVFTADKRFAVPSPLKTIALDADGVASIKTILDA